MMKLILSLTLIWTLSSTAEPLQCWHGEGDETRELRPCDSTDLCASVAAQGYMNQNLQQTNRLCLPSSLFSEGKHTFSYNVGFETMTASVHVCNTDGCNSEDIPFPDLQEKNNLKCFTSDDPSSAECNQTVQCEGVQDRCFSRTDFLVMMKLILSLTLIWTLSSTAEALKCWVGEGSDSRSRPCDLGDRCATVAARVYWKNKINITSKRCVPSCLLSDGNHIFSLTGGGATVTVSVYVCNTDECNEQDIPYPCVQKKNNRTCLTCDDPSSDVCDKKVQCRGDEDHCINGRISPEKDGIPLRAMGCASANLCEAEDQLNFLLPTKFIGPPQCCKGNLCNSAWSVKLSVITLLFGLITLIFY